MEMGELVPERKTGHWNPIGRTGTGLRKGPQEWGLQGRRLETGVAVARVEVGNATGAPGLVTKFFGGLHLQPPSWGAGIIKRQPLTLL